MPKHVRAFLTFVGWLMSWASASGQCPQAGLTIPDTVCINRALPIVNTSTGATRYEWDFCSGDLGGAPAIADLVTIPGASVPTNITTVFDGTNWFAFCFSRENNLLFRLDFGSSLDNTPTVVNLGNLGAPISGPEPVKFIKEGASWYAFAASLNNSTVVRLSFGAALTNTPSVTHLTGLNGLANRPRGLEVVSDNGNKIMVVTNSGDNTLLLVNFGSSFANLPVAGNTLKTPGFPGANNQLIGTALTKECNRWYGLTISSGSNAVFKLDFGTNLYSLPTVTNITANLPVINTPTTIALATDDNVYGFIGTINGSLFRLDFGSSISNNAPTVSSVNNAGLLRDIIGLSLASDHSRWVAFTTSYLTNKVYRVSFPNDCSAGKALSGETSPADIVYSKGGAQKISLRAFDGSNHVSTVTRSVFVRSVVAPDFTVQGGPPVFTARSTTAEKVTAWEWDFGDNTTGSGQVVQHTYAANGVYAVTLTARDDCGQPYSISRRIGIESNAFMNCPRSVFDLPDTVCTGQALKLNNRSQGVIAGQEWDFCAGDIAGTPVLSTIANLANAVTPTDITTVFDGVNWFSFISSRDNNKLFRLDYGVSLSNAPAVTDLGNPGGVLSNPEQMKLMKVGGEWFGLVVNLDLNSYPPRFSVVRLSFGNSLTNTPSAARITSLEAHLNIPRGLELINDNGSIVALIANAGNNVVTVANFGSSLSNPLTDKRIKNITLPGASSGYNVMGVAVTKQCNRWVGLAASLNNRVYKIHFGTALFTDPERITEITTTRSLSLSPVKVGLAADRGKYYALLMHLNGSLITLDFGSDLLGNQTPATVNRLDIVGDFSGMELVQSGSENFLFTVDWLSKRVYRGVFPQSCPAAQSFSTASEPAGIQYQQGGMQVVTLKTFDDAGNSSFFTDSVFVRPEVVPDFAVSLQCRGAATRFVAAVAPTGNRITGWTWDFGDGTTGSGANVTHTFAEAGSFPVTLTITDVCGSIKTAAKTIVIYRNAEAAFTAPTTACSNSDILFGDASSVFDDVTTNWLWDFGDHTTADVRNATHRYTQSGTYPVTLSITGRSGCTQTVTRSITITPGAAADFSVEGTCTRGQVAFKDLTTFEAGTGAVSYQWDFGDGNTSTLQNPTHAYGAVATYPVRLTVTNDNGCTTFKQSSITIRVPPQAAYSHSLVCSGEPASFLDESTSEDGGIAAWAWDFGDPASGLNNTSGEQNPHHVFKTAGTYRVKLKVFTLYGCADSLTREVVVNESPGAVFGYTLDCQTRQVQFTDQSTAAAGNEILRWVWNFGDGQVSFEQSPAHTYAAPGDYKVTLLATAKNLCSGVREQVISIAPPPVADFSAPASVCTGQPVTFVDKTAPAGEPILSWAWDLGAAGQSTEQNPQFTFTAGGSVPVTLTVTTASGCTSRTTRTIAVEAGPTAQFTAQPVTSLRVQFNNASSSDAQTFRWEFGDGKGSTERNPLYTYTEAGIYPVKLTAANAAGCTGELVQNVVVSSVVSAAELKLESVAATLNGNQVNVKCLLLNGTPHTIKKLDLITSLENGVSYTEEWNGIFLPGSSLTYSFALPAGMGLDPNPSAVVCLQARDQVHQSVSNRNCAGITGAFTVLKPFPNPASSLIVLPFYLPEAGNVRIHMTDLLGRTVYALTAGNRSPGYNEILVRLHQLSEGIYHVRYQYNGMVRTEKILVTGRN